MLTIVNYKKINNQWYGDWQIGKIVEEPTYYGLQAFHKNGRSVTIVIFREDRWEGEFVEMAYKIAMMDDSKGVNDSIEDIIYKSTLEDMELFGESLSHYLNSI